MRCRTEDNLESLVLTFRIRLQGIRRRSKDARRDVVAVKQGESEIRVENLSPLVSKVSHAWGDVTNLDRRPIVFETESVKSDIIGRIESGNAGQQRLAEIGLLHVIVKSRLRRLTRDGDLETRRGGCLPRLDEGSRDDRIV